MGLFDLQNTLKISLWEFFCLPVYTKRCSTLMLKASRSRILVSDATVQNVGFKNPTTTLRGNDGMGAFYFNLHKYVSVLKKVV